MSLPNTLTQLLSAGDRKDIHAATISNGLIHQTFCLTVDDQAYLLQSINKYIFPNPEGLIKNHVALYEHFNRPGSPFEHPLVKPLPFPSGNYLFTDELEQHWRLAEFIPGACTRSEIEETSQAEALADFFASFTRHASKINVTDWHIPLTNFHDLSFRYDQFQDAVQNDIAGRKSSLDQLIVEMKKRRPYVDFFSSLHNNAHFPLRMMHHDAKLSNVLIDERFHTWLCPIDLDTVMPGYFFSDIGDMIRSICNGAKEEDSPSTEVQFHADLYEALLAGYRNGMKGTLTKQEDAHLDVTGIIMTYMQSLRFLTDHLNGDVYYQIDQPGQNLDRAVNQLAFLKKMEEYLSTRGRFSMDIS